MDLERKTIGFDVKEVDAEEGTFMGYAATFTKHPDSYGDIIEPGAFKKTLKEMKKRIKILWHHDPWEPIGIPVELFEDDKGLFVKGKLSLGVQRAREVLELMKDGVVTEMSIGYMTIKDAWENDVRHLKEIKLFDVSPVTFAANPDATITGAKAEEVEGDSEGHSDDNSPEPTGADDQKAGRVLSASNLSKLKDAITALQALLEAASEEEEPDKSTPDDLTDEEAAELEAVVSQLSAGNEGFDVKEAEARIESILERISKE